MQAKTCQAPRPETVTKTKPFIPSTPGTTKRFMNMQSMHITESANPKMYGAVLLMKFIINLQLNYTPK